MIEKMNSRKLPVYSESDRTFVSKTPYDGYYDGLWHLPDENPELINENITELEMKDNRSVPNSRPYVACAVFNFIHIVLTGRVSHERGGRTSDYLLDISQVRKILDP